MAATSTEAATIMMTSTAETATTMMASTSVSVVMVLLMVLLSAAFIMGRVGISISSTWLLALLAPREQCAEDSHSNTNYNRGKGTSIHRCLLFPAYLSDTVTCHVDTISILHSYDVL
jgi:hypothetical protein